MTECQKFIDNEIHIQIDILRVDGKNKRFKNQIFKFFILKYSQVKNNKKNKKEFLLKKRIMENCI